MLVPQNTLMAFNNVMSLYSNTTIFHTLHDSNIPGMELLGQVRVAREVIIIL